MLMVARMVYNEQNKFSYSKLHLGLKGMQNNCVSKGKFNFFGCQNLGADASALLQKSFWIFRCIPENLIA